jgi:TPR repeat protein
VRTPRPGGGAVVPLRLKPARQPEGGAVRVKLDIAPREGSLVLDGRTLGAAAEFSGADLARLGYRSDRPGTVTDMFSFAVRDEWGSHETGFVTVALEPSDTDALVAAAEPARPQLGRVQASASSVVGLGPNLKLSAGLPAAAPAKAGQGWVRLAAAPSGGQLMLGERRLDDGRLLPVAELPNLAFRPSIGSEGRVEEAVFRTEEPGDGEVRLRIRVDLHPCDRLAAHLFDTQAVTPGVPVEKLEAEPAREACEAAVRDHPEVARFHSQLGRAYLALRRNADGLATFERAARMGHRRAAAIIGGLHLIGMLVPQDAARARALYEQAAEAGDIIAAQALGQMYYEGRGVERDLARARELFEKGVEVGSTSAMNSLGRMYSLGEGVAHDGAVAARFWAASAERGDIYGINNLGFVHLNGLATSPDPERALAYFRQAAELGHPQAPNNVGRLFAEGRGVRANLAEAAKWYRLGADRGDAWAALNLANMHRAGHGVRPDLVAAARLYARAAALPQLQAAEQGAAAVAQLDPAAKLRALRSLMKALRADPGEGPASKLVPRAAALAAERGAAPASQELDHVLIAAAKAEWLALGARLDHF